MTALEVRVPSLLGEHVVQMTSLAMIERHLRIEGCRVPQVRRISGRRDSHPEKVLWAAINVLLDARLDWVEAEMAELVDAWAPMPDFSELVWGRSTPSREQVAA